MVSDRARALADYAAARAAGVKLTQHRSQFQQLVQLWKQDTADYQADVQAVQQAPAALKAGSGK